MRTHIVMDASGDTRTSFDIKTSKGVADAMMEFETLLQTHTAARMLEPGKYALVREFDPTDTELVFFRRVVGG